MYNGIGLQTARGSGTNGYVQRNLSFVRLSKPKVDYKTEEEIRKFDSEYIKPPNQEILEHHRKRKIEVQCLELEEKLEKQGLTEEEIQKRVDEHRQELLKKMQKAFENRQEFIMEIINSKGSVKETHQLAELNRDRNDKLKAALGISEDFVAGSSMDVIRKAKEQQLAKEEMLKANKDLIQKEIEKQSTVVASPSGKGTSQTLEPSIKTDVKDKNKKRRHSSSSDDSFSSSSSSSSSDSSSDSSSSSSPSSSESDDSSSESSDSGKDSSPVKRHRRSNHHHDHHHRKLSRSRSPDHRRHSKHQELDSRRRSRRDDDHHHHRRRSCKSPEEKTKDVDDNRRRRDKDDNKHRNGRELSKHHGDDRDHRHRDDEPKHARRSRSSSHHKDKNSTKRIKRYHHRSSVSSDSEHNDDRRKEKDSRRHHQKNYPKNHSSGRHRHHTSSSSSSSSEPSSDSSDSSSNVSADDKLTKKSMTKKYSRSRSPSIPRRQGSPSFLEKRRITSARKRPVPYKRNGSKSSISSPSSSLASNNGAGTIGACFAIELSPPLRYRS